MARGGSIAGRRPVAYVEFASAMKNLTSYYSSSQQDTSLINLKAAKALGLDVPLALLQAAATR
jgi:hypothetical protein